MKNLIIIFIASLFIFGCKKTATPEPIAPQAIHSNASSTNSTAVTTDSIPADSLKSWIYGHTYEATYYNADNGTRIDTTNKYSSLYPNHLVWSSNGSVKEYNYSEPAPYSSGNYFSYGSYQFIHSYIMFMETSIAPITIAHVSGYTGKGCVVFSINIPSHYVSANTVSPNIRIELKMIN